MHMMDWKNNKEVEQIYICLKEQIYEKSQQQRQLLLAYIEQIGMKGSCAIVDIGWHGSMQYCLEQIAKYNGLDFKNLWILYWNLSSISNLWIL